MDMNKHLDFLRQKYRYIAILISFVILISGYIIYSKTAFVVKLDNEKIGLVKDKKAVEIMINTIKNDKQQKFKKDIKIGKKLTFEKVMLSNNQITPMDKIKSSLYNGLYFKTNAYAFKIDGKNFAFVESKEIGDKILEKIKNQYVKDINKEKIKEVSFFEKIEMEEIETNIDNIKDMKNVMKELLAGEEAIKKYKVKSGDTAWDIAPKFNLAVEDLKVVNPKINIENLQIGQEINVSILKPYINVKTIEMNEYEEKIPYSVVYQKTNTLYEGENKIKQKGIEGTKKVNVELVKMNGILENENIIDEKVMREPENMIVLKGTKKSLVAKAYGKFDTPTRGKLTSRFGKRWGKSHKGIDIAAPVGTKIKAADSGKVIFAGWKNGYGKVVIISHGNRYETYYAHCNTIKVKKGDSVKKGQVIATVGKTGRVTGANLHFETRKNGVAVDPLKYIKY